MKSLFVQFPVCLGWLLLACAAVSPARGAASDINSPDKRHATVERAARLAKPSSPAALPADLAQPFSPPGFELTDAEEQSAANALAGKTTSAPKATSDRETLEQIASKVPPSGTVFIGGEPRLIFGKKTVKIGTHFTVTFNGLDYDLELVNIDRTTFTLRLNREEITRPIKPAKSQ
jgi:hypothetical protein